MFRGSLSRDTDTPRGSAVNATICFSSGI